MLHFIISVCDEDYREHEKKLGYGLPNSYQTFVSPHDSFERVHEPATPEMVPIRGVLSSESSFDKKGNKLSKNPSKEVTFGEPKVQVFVREVNPLHHVILPW